ncbi:c2h2 type zinc finger domain containing protein [Niveomyces insectorum RCEF 264]|uniref:C2h2 type zinc finger domain containing protein n=1 Tax=Niveomyces insectorum RCEF 264 TaxID=1081102 RepID=A0A168ADV0_9HYPO|nr:c2h2 type zinc finger domain containing protein [Niveomyces insectorum RCEF 264]
MDVDAQGGQSGPLYQPGPPPPAAAASPFIISRVELAPKSPSAKRHKCPYCDTEFTRHHNLKSHLLTHSQEKPYICQGCDMRFRRLHDLKRHSKLHTGEKPHICPRCDRKFARGDALARHSKGAGGCAGRRSSSGHFGGASADGSFEGNSGMADGGDDSAMAGTEYNGADEEERRRLGLPSGKAQHVRDGRTSTDGFGRAQTGTYASGTDGGKDANAAPAASAVGGSLYPPSVDGAQPAASSPASLATSTANAAGPGSAGKVSLFSQHGVAESPKVANPAVGHDAANAPGSQSTYTQRLLDMASEQGLTGSAATAALQMLRPSEGGSSSSNSNGDTNANIFSSEQGMWTYVQTLEDKLKFQDERLKQQDERIALMESAKQAYEAQIQSYEEQIVDLKREIDLKRNIAALFEQQQQQQQQQQPLEQQQEQPELQQQQQQQPLTVSDPAPSSLISEAVAEATSAEAEAQAHNHTSDQHIEQQLQQEIGQELRATAEL